MPFREPNVVAEIGCNHQGDVQIAKELVKKGVLHSGVNWIKSQKRDNSLLADEPLYRAPHPVPENAFGDDYHSHRESLELSVDEHAELRDLAKDLGANYFFSVWDIPSAQQAIDLNLPAIKIPSARNADYALLNFVYKEFPMAIHISTGMTTAQERMTLIEFIRASDRLSETVIYHCTAGYPIDFDDCCLGEIPYLRELVGSEAAGVGFSGHHRGIAVDIGAIALGASWIERHFTLDRTMKGTDHAASLEPDGLKRLVRDCAAMNKALSKKPEDYLLDVEQVQRDKLRADTA